jgi:hypothetical protein
MYRSSKSAEPFLLGAVTRNEQNKKNKEKLTQSLYVDPLWAGLFDRLMMSFCLRGVPPIVMNCVAFGFDRSRGVLDMHRGVHQAYSILQAVFLGGIL